MAIIPYTGATSEQLQHPLVREFLGVHNMFRQELANILNFTEQLLAGEEALSGPETQARMQMLIRAGSQYTQYLHFHHHGESSMMFPKLAEEGLEAGVIARLEREHDEIAGLIDKFSEAIRNLATVEPEVVNTDLRRLSEALQAHLAYEETHVCPLLTRFASWPGH